MTASTAPAPMAASQRPLARQLRWALVLLPLVAIVVSLLLGYQLTWSPVVDAVGAVLLLYLVTLAVLGRANPLALVMGADGIPSASKFQHFVWTGVFVFSYVLLWATRAANGDFDTITDIPENVVIAMGLSIGTLLLAKGIKVSQVEAGLAPAPRTDGESSAGVAGLVAKDDLETPDLAKIQMLAWTVIAASIYLLQVWQVHESYAACARLPGPNECAFPGFPDIDTTLMVLMGLGQSAYLGHKFVSKPSPTPEASSTRAAGTTVVFDADSTLAGRRGSGA